MDDSGAGNEIRTRDPNLGKVVLYQLSYSRCEEARILAVTAVLSSFQRHSPEGVPASLGQASRRYNIMLQSVINTARYSRT